MSPPKRPSASTSARKPRPTGRPLLAQRRPLLKEIDQLERKLAKWNEEKAALDAQFADPEFYATV